MFFNANPKQLENVATLNFINKKIARNGEQNSAIVKVVEGEMQIKMCCFWNTGNSRVNVDKFYSFEKSGFLHNFDDF